MEKFNFLEEVNKELEKEAYNHLNAINNLKNVSKVVEDSYKQGFHDCLRYIGAINEKGEFDLSCSVYLAIYNKLDGMKGIKEMVDKYMVKDGEK